MLNRLRDLWHRSPARIMGLIKGLVALAFLFGVQFEDAQLDQIADAVAVFLTIWAGSEITRSQVYSPNTVEAIQREYGKLESVPTGGGDAE